MLALTVLLGMVGPPAPNLDGARNFVQSIYARYSLARDPDFLGQDGKEVFSPSLFRLIKQDVESTPQGFVGRLDFDPICSCQDAGGLRVEAITLDPVKSHFALSTVTLRYADATTRTVRLTLVSSGGTWKV